MYFCTKHAVVCLFAVSGFCWASLLLRLSFRSTRSYVVSAASLLCSINAIACSFEIMFGTPPWAITTVFCRTSTAFYGPVGVASVCYTEVLRWIWHFCPLVRQEEVGLGISRVGSKCVSFPESFVVILLLSYLSCSQLSANGFNV